MADRMRLPNTCPTCGSRLVKKSTIVGGAYMLKGLVHRYRCGTRILAEQVDPLDRSVWQTDVSRGCRVQVERDLNVYYGGADK